MIDWTLTATLLVVLAPVAAVPLAAMTFYLKALRDHQTGRVAELTARLDRLDGLADSLLQRTVDVERGSTTREEWIRENMLARKERQMLTNAVVRVQTELQGIKGG